MILKSLEVENFRKFREPDFLAADARWKQLAQDRYAH